VNFGWVEFSLTLGNFQAMTPQEFIKKWKPVALTERAAAHSHFLDVCALVEHKDPVTADPKGEWFAFEKGATKTGGGQGFADVWKKGFFAWEYKKKKRDLNVAMEQLVRYAAALENPPLQVVCDTDRFIIRTAWTNAVPKTYEFTLDDLVDPKNLNILHSVFFDPEKLRPTETRAGVTRQAADKFSEIAGRLKSHGSTEEIAHFINQLVFCFFANSVKLLPDGFFPKLLDRAAQKPERAQALFNQLFKAMENGGEFDLTDIAWFNGGLFDGRRALPLNAGDIVLLQSAASFDWSQIDPSIFGTLFEHFLDPDKRAQVGTHNTGVHYTDAVKIMMIVEPVILRPLRAEWAIAKAEIEGLLHGKIKPPMRKKPRRRMTREEAAEEVRQRFLERLRRVRILDPACGSGNFLYLSLQGVKDLENVINLQCEALGLAPQAPTVGPEIVHGIEINPLAAELARTTIWIGDIQWRRRNGIHSEPPPILQKLEAIECRDALIKKEHGGEVVEAEWPKAEFIVGNPPFLGGKIMRTGLGDDYVESLFLIYKGRVPPEADLVLYWFDKARAALKSKHTKRIGLVATNSIRGGANRRVIDRLVEEEINIFEAWSDEPWVVDGAAVRVSIICYGVDSGIVRLNGVAVSRINADLTATDSDFTKARRLNENRGISFMGVTKSGPFDVESNLARKWLLEPTNVNNLPNSVVLRRSINGQEIMGRNTDRWLLNFEAYDAETEIAPFAEPYKYAKQVIYPERQKSKTEKNRASWWRYERPRPDMYAALAQCARYIATSMVAKHRVFIYVDVKVVPENLVIVVARNDDTFLGLLSSRFHELWSRQLGTSLEDRPRYTPTTTFETFPFPEGLTPNISAKTYASDPRAIAIANAAANLDKLRNNWLNPSDLVRIEPEIVPTTAKREKGAKPIYPDRILSIDAAAEATLRKLTLTNLYNQRPQWLIDAHHALDDAVAAAYGWSAGISDDDALAELLKLNLSRAAAAKSGKAGNADGDLLVEEE
jgi:type II restriction/modification system DNA methylase subunit YeeA